MPTGCDVLIVGAGSAGCALAHRLSADPARRVCLIEAGGSDDRDDVRQPNLTGSLWGSDVDWQYRSTPQPAAHGRRLLMPRGKVLGGSSSINGNVYLRGAAADYDRWERLGATGWGWDAIRRDFDALEALLRPAFPETHHPLSEAMLDAALQAGHPANHHFDTGRLEGAGWNRLTVHQGQRMNAHRAFLSPIGHRPNLTVLPETQAIKILFEGQRAMGVRVRRNGATEDLHADEVVLSAGTYDSPRLLLLSGIGPGEHLTSLGIDVTADLPVGDNLTDHLFTSIVFTARQPISDLNAYLVEGCVFARSSPDAATPDLEIPFGKIPRFTPAIAGDAPCFVIYPCLTFPRSRGTVRLAADDPDVPAVIDPACLQDPADLRAMVTAVRLARNIVAQPALDPWRAEEAVPGPAVESDEAIADSLRATVNPWFHPTGTCKMGQGSDAVVAPDLRVQGISGLRVADASVIPDTVSANTNAASMLIGWRAATYFA